MNSDILHSLSKAINSLMNVQLDLNTERADSIIDGDGTIGAVTVAEAGSTVGGVVDLLRVLRDSVMAAQIGPRTRSIQRPTTTTTTISEDSIATATATLPIRPTSSSPPDPSNNPFTNNPTPPVSQANPSTLATLLIQPTDEAPPPPAAPSTKRSARARKTNKHEHTNHEAPKPENIKQEQRGFIHYDCAQNCNPSEGKHVLIHKLSGDTCIVQATPIVCADCKGKGKCADA